MIQPELSLRLLVSLKPHRMVHLNKVISMFMLCAWQELAERPKWL